LQLDLKSSILTPVVKEGRDSARRVQLEGGTY